MFLQYCILSIHEKSFVTPFKYIIKGGYGPGGYYTIVMLQIILLFPIIYNIIKRFKNGFVFIVLLNIVLEFIWSTLSFLNLSIFELYSKEVYRLLAFRYLGFIALGAWYAKSVYPKYIVYKFRYIIGIVGICIIYLWQYKGIKTYIFDNDWMPTTLPCIFIAFAYFIIIKEIDVKTYRLITELSKSTFHVFLFQMCYFGFIVPIINMIYDKISVFTIVLSIPICFCGGYLFYKCEYLLHHILNKILKD